MEKEKEKEKEKQKYRADLSDCDGGESAYQLACKLGYAAGLAARKSEMEEEEKRFLLEKENKTKGMTPGMSSDESGLLRETQMVDELYGSDVVAESKSLPAKSNDKDEHDKKKEEHDINNNEGQAQKRKASGYPDTEAADIAKIARWNRTDGGREPDVL